MTAGATGSATNAAGEDTLAPLREHLDPKAFLEMVALYEATVANRATALAAAARRRDLESMRRNAHDLAGMCGQLGDSRATALARRLESACAEGRAEEAFMLAAELEPAVSETLATLAGLDR